MLLKTNQNARIIPHIGITNSKMANKHLLMSFVTFVVDSWLTDTYFMEQPKDSSQLVPLKHFFLICFTSVFTSSLMFFLKLLTASVTWPDEMLNKIETKDCARFTSLSLASRLSRVWPSRTTSLNTASLTRLWGTATPGCSKEAKIRSPCFTEPRTLTPTIPITHTRSYRAGNRKNRNELIRFASKIKRCYM